MVTGNIYEHLPSIMCMLYHMIHSLPYFQILSNNKYQNVARRIRLISCKQLSTTTSSVPNNSVYPILYTAIIWNKTKLTNNINNYKTELLSIKEQRSYYQFKRDVTCRVSPVKDISLLLFSTLLLLFSWLEQTITFPAKS